MTTVVNQQRRIPIDTRQYELFADQAIRVIREANNLTPAITIVGDDEMRRLNREFRNKDSTTDVLSFRYLGEEFETDDSLGDIVISAEQALRQAIENGLNIDLEMRQLILHGILHLCGFDHETDSGEMDAREIELREQLGIS